MEPPGVVGASREALLGRLDGARQVAEGLEELDVRGVERREPLGRRRSGAERRRPREQAVLELALVLVEQRAGDR